MDVIQPDDALSHLRIEFARLCQTVVLQQSCQSLVRVRRKVFVHLDGIVNQQLAVFDVTTFFPTEILIETVPRFRGRHHVQPFFLRMLTVGREYLYLVAAFQLIRKRY